MSAEKEFKITYRDPDTNEKVVTYQKFEDTPTITAKQWAEDYAYTLADKGWYTVEEVK